MGIPAQTLHEVPSNDPGLIEHLLTILDRRVTASHALTLRQRIATRDHEYGHIVRVGVQEPHRGIGEADIHVHRRRRHLPGRQVVTVRHCHDDVLVRSGDRLRDVLRPGPGVGFDERREIRAGIYEQLIDSVRLQGTQYGFARRYPFGHTGFSSKIRVVTVCVSEENSRLSRPPWSPTPDFLVPARGLKRSRICQELIHAWPTRT